ncbi:hypothetical protein E2562_032626 [Oryza meyeriana var. granulata]|uniref:Uncharacterized protein n=1 Tax=Oryza meyeriana var. granulata TaxID=110450 RepID=A0A6G1D926_9ORYZ|nr:hypothetical protein E2562_032626 [Oryza meyeriana var. granulata]
MATGATASGSRGWQERQSPRIHGVDDARVGSDYRGTVAEYIPHAAEAVVGSCEWQLEHAGRWSSRACGKGR